MNEGERAQRPGHEPVMVAEVLRDLITDPDGLYIDATIGGGGHAEAIMKTLTDRGRLIGFDRDSEAVAHATRRLSVFGDRLLIRHADYRDLARHCEALGIAQVTGILMDLGLSSLQLNDPSRGMSFQSEGPLDLRFDTTSGMPAHEWLRITSESQIADAIYKYGEEPRSRAIARRIVVARNTAPISTSRQLLAVVESATGISGPRLGRIAARVWQALRIVVNDELGAVTEGVKAAIDCLDERGRLVVLTYHSLEDRIVKEQFREAARACTCPPAYPRCICGADPRGRVVHRRVLRPAAVEVERNPRARAAKMRVFERLTGMEGAR